MFQFWLWIFLLLSSLANMIVLMCIQLSPLWLGIVCSSIFKFTCKTRSHFRENPRRKREKIWNIFSLVWTTFTMLKSLQRLGFHQPSWRLSDAKIPGEGTYLHLERKQLWSSGSFCTLVITLTCSWLSLSASFLPLEQIAWEVLHFRIIVYFLSFSVHSSGHDAAEVLAPPECLSSCSPLLGQACQELHSELLYPLGLNFCRMWWNALDMCVIRDYGKKQN